MLNSIEFISENYSSPVLKHKGRTQSEQLELNQPAINVLKKWLEEDLTEEEETARDNHWKSFTAIIDSARPEGHKLYTKE